jgi:hypothetical protein
MPFTYQTGEEVMTQDRITYQGEAGSVEFVIVKPTGDLAMDWYLEEFPGGGFMIDVPQFGSLFLTETDEDLQFVSRMESSG